MLPGYGAVPPLTTYTYDGNNRLTQATGPGGTVTHTYSGDGLKVRRVGPDGTRLYYHDGIRPIYETNATGALLMRYDRDLFGNLLSSRDPTGGRRYYHHDGLGSTTALTDATGAVAATMLYDAWGNQRAATGSGHGRYRFTGAERDDATGLYHMGARFYDPAIGRWLSEDPVQDKSFEPAMLNFYAYVQNNPGLYIDPDGRAMEAPFPQNMEIVLALGLLALGVVMLASNPLTDLVMDLFGRKQQEAEVKGQARGDPRPLPLPLPHEPPGRDQQQDQGAQTHGLWLPGRCVLLPEDHGCVPRFCRMNQKYYGPFEGDPQGQGLDGSAD